MESYGERNLVSEEPNNIAIFKVRPKWEELNIIWKRKLTDINE